MFSSSQVLLQNDLLAGLGKEDREELIERFEKADARRRDQLLSNQKILKVLLSFAPPDRFHAIGFLLHEGAQELFGPGAYAMEPTLEKIASYLKKSGNALPGARLVRKLGFYLTKHGPLHMRGFIERFEFDHLIRAFTTRVLHTICLADKFAFNIPLFVDPVESKGQWRDTLRDRIRKCWLLSYIDSPQRARPTPEALEISSRFNLFTDLNYRALYQLNLHEKTVGTCLDCLEALEKMLRCYLELFFDLSSSAPMEELEKKAIEAEVFQKTREEIEDSLRQELNLLPETALPLSAPLPPHTEAILMAYDGEKANRYIISDLRELSATERAHVSAAELINILHQRGLARGPAIFDRLRQAGGRVITEISTGRDDEQSSKGVQQAVRTNDFITFIDLRQSRQGGSLPFPVRVIVDAVTRNANIIPDSSRLKLVIYAGELETHMDIRIGGHSARVHYSLAPPERGGRFALQYAEGGDEEGNLRRLELMARSFRKAGLEVTISGQLLEAVYDKDCGATTLDAVREKAALGLQILNSMPDLDYALHGFNGTYSDPASVNLFGFFDRPAMEQILEAWAQHCYENGFFFLDLLRPVRKGEDQFYHRSELYWDGRGPYTDPYQQQMQKYGALLDNALRESTARVGIPAWDEARPGSQPLGQSLFDHLIDLENRALRHSLLVVNERGFARGNPVIRELRQHPVTLFIDFLKNDAMLSILSHTAHLAEQISNLGSWEDLGKLGGLWVSRLRISIIKDVLSFFVLRVPEGNRILLAFTTIGEDPLPVPFIDRMAERIRPSNVITTTAWIGLVLNLFGYRVEEKSTGLALDWDRIQAYLEQPNPPDIDVGVVSIPGIITSPGIVTGRFRANAAVRPLEDFQDGILVDHYLTPSDDAKIQASRGVLITSGGELSHAAIRTREFRKPSLILKDVEYRNGVLNYLPHYNRCSMTCYPLPLRDIVVHACYCAPGNLRAITARDGDLMRLDADRGELVLLGDDQSMQQNFQLILTLQKYPHMESLWQEMSRQFETVQDSGNFLFLLSEWVLVQELSPERLRTLLGAAKSNPRYGREVEEFLRCLHSDMIRRTDSFLHKQRLKIIRSSTLMELFHHLGAAVLRCESLENLENLVTGKHLNGASVRERLSRLSSMAWGKIEQYRPVLLNDLSAALARPGEDSLTPQFIADAKRLLKRCRDASLDWEPQYMELAERVEASQQRKIEQISALQSSVEFDSTKTCYLLPKAGLDSDFRPLVGGKAAHCGEILLALRGLENKSICVPRGFATTTFLWRKVRENVKEVVNILADSLTQVLLSHLLDQLDHLESLLVERRISSVPGEPDWTGFRRFLAAEGRREARDLQEEVERFCFWLESLEEVRGDSVLRVFAEVFGRFAVRSSGVREDSLEESFAGQKLTVLNVLGPTALCRAIGDVLSSGAEAVLVEEMIPAEVSGVAFSVHPATGNFGQILINSAYGLGEGVVSGKVDPDTLIIDKKTGRLLGQPVLGAKLTRIVPASEGAGTGGTTREEPVPDELQRQLSLRDHQQTLLVSVVRTLEDHFDYPLDVEWAVDPLGRLFVLQSRPITTLWRTLDKGKSLMTVKDPGANERC